MHIDQINSGQHELYREFGINFSHFADPEAYYKRVKEELVLGFRGIEGDDSKHSYTALLTIFLITVVFTWHLLLTVVGNFWPKFADARYTTDYSVPRMFVNSLLDIFLTVLPIMVAWANYEAAFSLHLYCFGIIAWLFSLNRCLKRARPIFSDWVYPGGKATTPLYSFEVI